MNRGLLYEKRNAHKVAHVYARTYDSFRVFMYDGYFDIEREEYTTTKDDAEKIADSFCNS